MESRDGATTNECKTYTRHIRRLHLSPKFNVTFDLCCALFSFLSDKMAGNMSECMMVDEDTVVCNGITFTRPELLKDTSAMFWVYLCVYIALVLFAGKLITNSRWDLI